MSANEGEKNSSPLPIEAGTRAVKNTAAKWIASIIAVPALIFFVFVLGLMAVIASFGDSPSGIASTGPPTSMAQSLIPPDMLALYQKSAQERCPQLPWSVLAAIGHIESNDNRNKAVSSAGAVGPMQFMPATWLAYGIDGNGDGIADIRDPEDAVPSAALYLCAQLKHNGGNLSKAIFQYNHAQWYVDEVLKLAEQLASTGFSSLAGGNSAQLAQRILANPNISTAGRLVYFDLSQQANGGIPSAGVPLHANLLSVLDYIGQSFTYQISALESGGTGHSDGSTHYQGAAADIAVINGLPTNGRDAYARALLTMILPVLPPGSRIGQASCGPPVLMPPPDRDVQEIVDSCDHLHLTIP